MSLRKLTQAGDTIIEVLLALAIISITLGSSYLLANRSQQAGRYAQERTEAQKLAETQFEKLKSLVPDNTKNLFDDSTAFCIDSGLNRKAFEDQPSASVDTDDFKVYPAACKSGIYNIAIRLSNATTDQFKVTVRWDRLGGGRDEVSMLYRTHYIDTANPIGPLVIPVPVAPVVPPASGSLSCPTTGSNSITVTYNFQYGTNVSLFRGDTLLQTALTSPKTYKDEGLAASTNYTYYLRNGTTPANTELAKKTCSTTTPPPPPSASASMSCSQPGGAFDNIYINYSFSGTSSVKLRRDGTQLATLSSSPGTYTDYNPINGGSFTLGTNYTYTLVNGSTTLASCNITSQTFDLSGIDLSGIFI